MTGKKVGHRRTAAGRGRVEKMPRLPLTGVVLAFTRPTRRRACIITTNFPPFPAGRPSFRGGISEEQAELAAELRGRGVSCEVLSLSLYGASPAASGVTRLGHYVPYQLSRARRTLFPYLEFFRPLVFLRSLCALRRMRPQVVEVGETRQLSLAPILASLLLHIPVVMRNDWLCPGYPRERACTARERLSGCGACLAPGAPAPLRWLVGIGSLALFRVRRWAWNRCAAVTVQSGYQRWLFMDWGIRKDLLVDAAPASLIGEDVRLTGELKAWARGKTVLLYVGRLTTEKGFPLLLEALQVVRRLRPDAVLLVAGEGPERREQDGVHYVGWVEKAHLGSAYRVADALVIPTIVPEGHPATVEDAFRYGVPVVATPVGALREMVGGRGWLSVGLSPEALAEAVVKAVEVLPGPGGRRKVMKGMG